MRWVFKHGGTESSFDEQPYALLGSSPRGCQRLGAALHRGSRWLCERLREAIASAGAARGAIVTMEPPLPPQVIAASVLRGGRRWTISLPLVRDALSRRQTLAVTMAPVLSGAPERPATLVDCAHLVAVPVDGAAAVVWLDFGATEPTLELSAFATTIDAAMAEETGAR